MSIVLQWILGSSGTAILIMLVCYFLQKHIKATWVYGLWLLLMVRLLCPYLPSSSWSLLNPIGARIEERISNAQQEKSIQVDRDRDVQATDNRQLSTTKVTKEYSKLALKEESLTETAAIQIMSQSNILESYVEEEQLTGKFSNTVGQIGVLIWVIGSGFVFLYYIAGAYFFYKKCRRLREIQEGEIIALYEVCRIKLNFIKPVKLLWGEMPMSYGVFKKYIILPEGYSNEAIENMLMHELVHHKRNDLLINIFIMISLIIHWFNPIIRLALYMMKHDAEIACDEKAVEILKDKQEYATVLLQISNRHGETSVIGAYMGIGKKQLKRRIIAMGKMKKRGIIAGSLIIVCGIGVGILCLTNSTSNNLVDNGVNTLSNRTQTEAQEDSMGAVFERLQFENPIQYIKTSQNGKNASVFDGEPNVLGSSKKNKLYVISQNGQISTELISTAKEALEKDLDLEADKEYAILDQSYEWKNNVFELTLEATAGDGLENWTAKKSTVTLTVDPEMMEDVAIQVDTQTVGEEFELSDSEQAAYEEYIKTKDVQVLQGLKPVEVAKIQVACGENEQYEAYYDLVITSESKEDLLRMAENSKDAIEWDEEKSKRRTNSYFGLLSEAKVITKGYGGLVALEYDWIKNDRVCKNEKNMKLIDGIWRVLQ